MRFIYSSILRIFGDTYAISAAAALKLCNQYALCNVVITRNITEIIKFHFIT